MAVTFVIGNTNRISTSLFGPGNTIASIVALEFPESPAGSLKLSSLLALGFILFVISFIVLAVSRLLAAAECAGMSATARPPCRSPRATPQVARKLGGRRRHVGPRRPRAVLDRGRDRPVLPGLDPDHPDLCAASAGCTCRC